MLVSQPIPAAAIRKPAVTTTFGPTRGRISDGVVVEDTIIAATIGRKARPVVIGV